jgi:hypothetical protein
MSTGGKKSDGPPAKQLKTAGEGPSRAVRILVSAAIVLHVLVLFLYPLANSRTSDTVRYVAQLPPLRFYADILYLNHGHGFFGPDPGASFIIEYQVQDKTGDTIAEGKFPDADRIWPRLRYHRYKMLADQLETPLPDAQLARDRKEFLLERYAQQLLRQYGGQQATVTETMHAIVPYFEWLGDAERGVDPKAIDDKSLYRDLMTVTQTRADVEAADTALLGNAEDAPQPQRLPEAVPGGAVQ